MPRSIPVSYTHLDVYKRQVQAHIDPSSKGLGEGEAPIGAYCYVSGAEPKELDISMTVQMCIRDRSMSAWDIELAKELRGLPKAKRPELMEGSVVSTGPLTVSLYDGEVMACLLYTSRCV